MPGMASAPDAPEALTAKFAVLLPHLDERQQRLYLGSEARALGRGGITAVARAAGVSRQTVAEGIVELDLGEVQVGRIRRSGGGRKRLTDLNPELRPALLVLIEPGTVEPTSPLRWTTKSTRRLADELTAAGHKVAADTVGNLLREEGFTLRTYARTPHLNRDEQFRHLNEQATAHHATGDPVLHVRARKRERGGQRPEPEWRPDDKEPTPGRAARCFNQELGADHDTAQLAVDAMYRWWRHQGKQAIPPTGRLLVVADTDVPEADRSMVWRTGLTRLAAETGVAITVCHLPPGTTKWNSIEHRSFAFATVNTANQPTAMHEVVVAEVGISGTVGNRTGVSTDGAAPPLPPGDWNYRLHPTRRS